MVINAMQYPKKEDEEWYMRIDVIEELNREVQQEKQGDVRCFAAKKCSIDGVELNGALQEISGASNMLNIEESQAAEFCSKQGVSDA
ncbi:hypothetical protein PIB30_090345, partial [Stylosanthes scabra]|nr:hypothetical protein [Stylosanthes scabra]